MTDREKFISTEMRAALRAERERLTRDLDHDRAASSADRIGQYAGEVHDRGEESSIDAQAEVNSAILRHHADELALVEHALSRIDAGTYGVCVGCGEDIEPARLRANPVTARCHACQSLSEARR